MIGKMMSDKLLDGHPRFYQWERGDPKELLPSLRERLTDGGGLVSRGKDACLAETAATFKGGGSMLKYLREPRNEVRSSASKRVRGPVPYGVSC